MISLPRRVVEGLADAEGDSSVVDVLGGEAEVDEVLYRGCGDSGGETAGHGHLVETLLDEVFDGFDVVVGNGFYFLDTGGVGLGEVAIEIAERLKERMGNISQLRERQFAECDEVFDFDAYTVSNEGVF